MGGANDYNPTLIGGASKLQNNLRKEVAIVNKHMKEKPLNQRRALTSINQNILGASLYPKIVNKGGFSGKDVNCDKSKNGLADPPNPRGLEEQAIRKQQLSPYQENTKPDLLLSDLKDHTAIDIEECEDVSVPMFVKHTEAVLDEADSMDVDDPIIDIDSNDVKDPLAVTEYVDGIYSFYKKSEISSVVAPNYMDYQSDINGKMRAILIDWLIEVHYKFELMNETLFLTVNIIDRFLEQQPVARKKLQLVGVTAMLLACKYEEISVPLVDDFVLISDKAYTTKEVLDMEKLMVNTLEFNMSVPTPYVFLMRYLKAAQSDRKLELLSFYIIELCMVEYEMLKFPPSLLAAAAVYTAQCSLCKFKQWTRTSEWYTDYSEDQLMDCSRLMVTFHQKAGTGKLTGVYRKYSSSKFDQMAKAQPADFLLDL